MRLARRAPDGARPPASIVSDIEARLGTRYTIDTVTALQRGFPQVEFVWLMGSDNLEQFSRWRRWQQICAAAFPSRWCSGPAGFWRRSMPRLARRFGMSRAAGDPRRPCVVLDGPRNSESATAAAGTGSWCRAPRPC